MNSRKVFGIILVAVPTMFIILGVFFVATADVFQRKEDDFNKNAVEIKVHVDEIDKDVSTNRKKRKDVTYTTYVSYVVNGKEYKEIKVSECKDKIAEEDTFVTMYYHRDKPEVIKIENKSDNVKGLFIGVGFSMLGLGAVVLVCGIFYLIRTKRAINKR